MAMGRPRSFDLDVALGHAMAVFWQRGYEGASLSELTRAMGISPPSLYAAFGSKEGLFKAVLARYAQDYKAFLERALAAPSAREAARLLLSGTVDLITDPCRPRGCLFVQGGLSCGSGSAGIPTELAAHRACTEQALQRRFEAALATGDLAVGTDPAALARYVATVANGLAVQASSGVARDELIKVADIAAQAVPAPLGPADAASPAPGVSEPAPAAP